MMSNARHKTRAQEGANPPKQAKAKQASPSAPMGAIFGAKRTQDDLRSKLRKFTESYKDLCDAATGDNRFRVRAEILPNSEEYITIEMGCNVPGIIEMPWKERSSSDVEIRYGSQLERYRNVLMIIRRSNDRLGYQLDTRGAVGILGTDAAKRLLMSNKDFNKLPRDQRDPREGGVPLLASRREAPTSFRDSNYRGNSGSSNYYQRASAEAAEAMAAQAASRHPRRWSDEMDEVDPRPGLQETSRQSAARAPILEQRAGTSSAAATPSSKARRDSSEEPPQERVRAVPAPTTDGVRKAPPPSSNAGGGSRKAPAPSTAG